MKAGMNALQGYKTYAVLGLSAAVWVLGVAGVLSAEDVNKALVALAIAGGGTIAAKINRLKS